MKSFEIKRGNQSLHITYYEKENETHVLLKNKGEIGSSIFFKGTKETEEFTQMLVDVCDYIWTIDENTMRNIKG